MLRNISLSFLTLLIGSSNSYGYSTNLRGFLANNACSEEIQIDLGPHLIKQTWVPKTVSVEGLPRIGGVSFRDTKKSRAFLLWREELTTKLSETDLVSNMVTEKSWSSAGSCIVKKLSPVKGSAEPSKIAPFTFSDKDLAEILASHRSGLIYVWSPSMPLSILGIAEIKKAAALQKHHLTILAEKKSSPKRLLDIQKKGQVDTASARVVSSNELKAREMDLHYPILFIYKDGFISNRTYVGHKKADMYVKWIVLESAELEKDLK